MLMENYMRSRVRERLSALGITAFEAARRVGAERTFLNDLLVGKKDTIRPAAIPKVAEVLGCDADYLVGAQATPRKPTGLASGTMPLAGICEAGAWRAPETGEAMTSLPVAHDPRFAPERQVAFLIRGHHADGLGLQDGDVVVAVNDGQAREGEVVIARRRREGGEVEMTVKLVEGDELRAKAGVASSPKLPLSAAEIVGRVIVSHRIFGK